MFPVTVTDSEGNMYVVEEGEVDGDRNRNLVTPGYIASENPVLLYPNRESINKEEASKRVENLTDSLIKQINLNLSNSTNEFFKLAYQNVNVLSEITTFDENLNSGGGYIPGVIKIGVVGFISGAKGTDGSDGDIMCTILHEYIHHLNYIYKIYPYKYDNEEEGAIFTDRNVSYKKVGIEPLEIFRKRIYEMFYNQIMTYDYMDYLSVLEYGSPYNELASIEKRNVAKIASEKQLIYMSKFHNELTDSEEKEFQDYIDNKKLTPLTTEYTIAFDYQPSNYYRDEINAYTLAELGELLNLYVLSEEKRKMHQEKIEEYTKRLEMASEYEAEMKIYDNRGFEKQK